MYRTAIIKRLPVLMVLDGKEILQDERERVEFQGGLKDNKMMQPMVHFS